MAFTLQLRLTDLDSVVDVMPRLLIVAGYTGRDHAAVQRHLLELAAQGIAPPPSIPMYYKLRTDLLETRPEVTVSSSETSGEVEPVYIRISNRWYLGVGSDHTDRGIERTDVASSKAACVKPIGMNLLPLPAKVVQGEFDRAWDEIILSSWVDDVPYQHGKLSSLMPPGELLSRMLANLGGEAVGDLVVYGGTIPLLKNRFVFGKHWEICLSAANYPLLQHSYAVSHLERD